MTIIRRTNSNYPVLNNWFEDLFAPVNNFSGNYYRNSVPAVNIAEDDNKFAIELAVPGLNKSDLSIHVENDVLTIKSEKEFNSEENNTNYTRKEFSYTGFERTFTLPDTVDGDKIKAGYKDGILSVEIPKKEEAKPKPAKLIEIA